MRKSISIALFALLMASFVAISVLAALQKSALYEENNTVSPGYYFFKTNDYRMGPVHPPLSYKLAALPLLAINPPFPYNSESCKKFVYYLCGIEFLYKTGNNGDMFIFLSRLVYIALGAVLGLFVFLWAKSIYGIRAGLFALALYAFNPVIIGWMGVVLNDAAVTAFIFINLFFFTRFIKKPSRLSLLLTGVTCGLAQASKITAMFLFPVYILFFVYMYKKSAVMPFSFAGITRHFSRMQRLQQIIRFSLNFLLVVLVAYAVVFAVYGFQVSTIASAWHPNHVRVLNSEISSALPEGSLARNVAGFIVNKVPLPFVSYFDGISEWVYMSTHSTKTSFFMGEIYSGKRFLFHPLSFVVKTPIPLLLMLALAALVFAYKRKLSADEAAILVFLAFFLFMFLFVINWNSGIQHMLPLYPFLILLAGRLFAAGSPRLLRHAASILLAWYIVGTLMAFPNYVAYFNGFMPADNSYKYFAGTNNDVGQDLKPLAKYLDKSGIGHVYLSYSATTPPEYYGINYTYLPSPPFVPWVPDYAPLREDLPKNFSEDCTPKAGIVAVSILNLDNVYLINQTCFDWLSEYTPIKKIGHTIFVYNITAN